AVLGGCVKELFERGRVRAGIERAIAAARDGRPTEQVWHALWSSSAGLPTRFAEFAEAHAHDEAVVNQALARLEHDIADTIARHSFITRISPMLGLMGTLIPLGPALAGLSAGNMGTLAGNLI